MVNTPFSPPTEPNSSQPPQISQPEASTYASAARRQHWAISLIDLLCIVLLQLVALDWFTSTVNPYPYFASTLVLIAALVPCTIYGLPIRSMSHSVKIACEMALAACMIFCLYFQSDACLLTTALLTAIIFGSAFIRVKLLRFAFHAVLIVALSYLAWLFVSSGFRGINLQNAWLGTGLGSSSSGAQVESLAATIVAEWGYPLVAALIPLLLLAFGSSVLSVAQEGAKPDGSKPAVISVLGAGAIVSLLYCSLSSATFFTTESIWGTWALALAIASIRLQLASEVNESRPAKKLESKPRTGQRPKLIVVVLTFTFALFLGVHLGLQHKTDRFVGLSAPAGYTSYVSLDQVSQPMQNATIAMEDSNFYYHHGFDWVAIHRALRVDLREGRILQGGSTLTQQLAKNLFLSNDRTISRKIEEAAYTVELEQDLPKRRILELYLNTIDYGMGQHGITNAAAYYFHTSPDKLTIAQSALLVGLVPSPPKVDPSISPTDPQYEDLTKMENGQKTATDRMLFFFPGVYNQKEMNDALSIPLDRLVYPYKDAWDRDATSVIPAKWHGVKFYFFSDPEQMSEIDNASPYLEPELAGFLDDARHTYGLNGIDHLGVYNDRGMRQAQTVLSAHAYGQAIDISGFRFDDGTQIAVKSHNDPRVLRRLISMEVLLRRHFDIVVDWKDDPLRHQTHFHCEVRGPRPNGPREVVSPAIEVASQLDRLVNKPGSIPERYKPWVAGDEVSQQHPMSCGPAAVATVLTYYFKHPTAESEVMRMAGSDGNSSVSMEDLRKACVALHYHAISTQLTLGELLERLSATSIPVPVLIMNPDGHFVDVIAQVGDNLLISDPNCGNRTQSISAFARQWSGEALIITR